MHVIRHENVGVNLASVTSRHLCQEVQVDLVVALLVKASRPVVASLNHVERQVGDS